MVKKILVIRFRQIGDAILSAALCSSLKRSFPSAEVHIVLNSGIAPLFETHPDIDKVIPFTAVENKKLFKYIHKVWSVVHNEEYDVIIDMRSTLRTLLFSFFSRFLPRRPFYIGRKKWYSSLLQNHNVAKTSGSMVDKNQRYADALSKFGTIEKVSDFRLFVSDDELAVMRERMQSGGIDFSRPVLLVGVTTKLLHKRWNMEYMRTTLKRIMSRYPNLQIIFNYAPGREEQDARELYEQLGCPPAVKIDVEARSLRELLALCALSTFYFGNEGGSRHIVQALGVPSYAIFSPVADKSVWLPTNNVPAYGIEADSSLRIKKDSELFDTITPDAVCGELFPLLDKYCK